MASIGNIRSHREIAEFLAGPILEFFNSIGHKQPYCLSRFALSGCSQTMGTSTAQGDVKPRLASSFRESFPPIGFRCQHRKDGSYINQHSG